MENKQYPNDHAPVTGQEPVQPAQPETPTYVRVEEVEAPPMAQPVGEVYEGATYVKQDAELTRVHQTVSEAEAPTATAPTQEENAQAAPKMADEQPANNGTVPPKQPGGKTKRKKHGNFGKFLAVLLIGALIGGASGGFVGYKMADSGYNLTPVSEQQKPENVSYDSEGNMTVASIANHAMPAVVSVYNMANASQDPFGDAFFGQAQGDGGASTPTGDPTAQGYGSGVLISKDGLIVTNYHVIEDSDSVVVTTEDDKEYEAEVLGTDSSLDLAVLKIKGDNFPYVDIADSDKVKVGELAVAIGNPLGSEFADTVTDGIISGVDRKISSENGDLGLLQTNASINSGNSGGALLNGQAQLIGINSMKIQSSGMSAVEGMGFAIPSNTVLDFVNSVKDGSHTKNSTKKAWIGITGYSMNESIARQLGTDQNTGILIAGVTEGSPAAEAGLQQADIIIKADSTDVETFEDLSGVIDSKQPGDTVELTVLRDGQTGKITVTLGTQR